jgi:hypothetical protein
MSDDEHELHRLLGEIVANQKTMFKEQQRINDILVAHFEDDKRQFERLNLRVRAVEQRINYAAGAVAVIGLAVTVFWEGIVSHWKW